MNKVILMGRLTRDPDVRYSQGDTPTAVARYTLAVDRRFRRDSDQQTADFIGCVAFGKSGEFAEKYLRKGTKIVVVEDQEFAESKAVSDSYHNGGGFQGADSYGNGGGFQPAGKPAPNAAVGDGFMNIPDEIDEELPFN